MRRSLAFGLLAIWMLTTGASCQTTVQGGNFRAEGSGAAAGVGVALFLVSGAIICLSDTEDCFLDEDEVRARAAAAAQVRATFTAALRRYREGDPTGLEGICLAAHQGYANAQYFYGVHLFKRDPARTAEGVAWLRRAAAQGHRAADILLRQVTGPAGPIGAEPAPAAVAPPAPACSAALAWT